MRGVVILDFWADITRKHNSGYLEYRHGIKPERIIQHFYSLLKIFFFIISYTVIHRTEVIKNTLNPEWRPFTLKVRALNNGDHDRYRKHPLQKNLKKPQTLQKTMVVRTGIWRKKSIKNT